ncbi:MAG TPA: SDR family NAD(P)-dependent oxidoreductase [Acidimicrobiia bacterium]|nr:SDR family NAD(P)-dependent oxidoreductase [Acidimicrobiia bacterium]
MSRPAVALVTGASSGLGREFARLLAADGHDLVLTARRDGLLRSLAAELAERHGTKSLVLPADLSEEVAPEELFAAVSAEGWPVDVLVNNAGIMGEGRLLDHPWSHHEALARLKFLSPFHLVHLFLPAMLERRRGIVLNVASCGGLYPSSPTIPVYGAANMAVVRLTRTLSREYRGSGVTFTALCPGATRTAMYDASVLAWTVPKFLTEPPEKVARRGWDGARAGRPLVIGGLNGLSMAIARRLPDGLVDQLIARWLIVAYDRRPAVSRSRSTAV